MSVIIKQVSDEQLTAEERFNLYVRLHIEYALKSGRSSLIYQKYWNLSVKNQSKYATLNQEYFQMVRNLVRERFPNEVEKDCFVPNATTFFLIDTLNNVPRIMNLKKLDLNCVVDDILYRLVNGFKKDL